MFYRERKEIAERLELLRQDTCCYMSPSFCDCKYGYKRLARGFPYGGIANHGEQTGCPELRCAIAVLNKMSDEEYEAIIRRKQAPPFKDAGAEI